MNEAQEAHEPPGADPADIVMLEPGARVRDARSGETTTPDAWIAACSEREQREPEQCREALMNAIARGDLVIENPG